jgi:hypothetical protein
MVTPAVTVPANYDMVVLHLDLPALKSDVDTITATAKNIVNTLQSIAAVMSGLQLSWAGQSANDAQQLFDNWSLAVRELFGNGDPTASPDQQGALNILCGNITAAVTTYGQTEAALAKNFSDFATALASSTPASGGNQNPKPDASQTAVGENF